MKDITLSVANVHVNERNARLTFKVTMDIVSLQPPSDSDGELFNQRIGQEILRQVIEQLRGDHV